MKSVMSHNFATVPGPNIARSVFDRSHGYKTTMDAGYLVPFYVDEALPGDTFSLRATAFARLATPIAPLMDNLRISTFFFAVPNRLLWSNFKKFMGEQNNPADSTSFVEPTITAPAVTGWTALSLQDYMGLPTEVASLTHRSLPLRAYNHIWNAWFRDENLQNSVVEDTDDGPDTAADYVLLRRGKRHDYFTGCLPWPQKGSAVSLPLGTSAPVYGNAATGAADAKSAVWQAWNATDSARQIFGMSKNSGDVHIVENAISAGLGSGDSMYNFNLGTAADYSTAGSNYAPPYADLSSATAATINSLRQAIQLQKMAERDARGGTRYPEIIRAHFDVMNPDARMQRPEYLGGGTSPISIHPVAKTSSTDGTSPQGNVAGFGTGSFTGHGFTKSFTEHCIVLGLVCVHADITYQQGLNRMWSRSTKYDHYWPSLSSIGEQAVLNKEIYCDASANDNLTFGYQERYAEYRYKPSIVTGQFRSNHATPLDMWHLAINFASLPSLNSTFIVENPDIDRVIAVPSQPHLFFDSYINLRCVRPMPVFSIPGANSGL